MKKLLIIISAFIMFFNVTSLSFANENADE
ncbi:hypothetical protein SAMN05216352_11031 [Alteribacillus bidgolensis]|uniref:Uncharacterized protein n=1 Tax=Alteribacillus bidgolensis TaxID=930129 RepID=A0A1G8MGK1_9BACI|nr:hypothetical protein SAMN05216352_11031 [Alteribacillus bidgolensis]